MSKGKGKGKSRQQTGASAGPWRIHFLKRPDGSVPVQRFLDQCPEKVAAQIVAVLKAVADGPPPAFSGGGKWEAMHDAMAGYYEIRVDGPQRHHYRLFCILVRDGADVGMGGPSVVALSGLDKPFQTQLRDEDYAAVRTLREEFDAITPRKVAT